MSKKILLKEYLDIIRFSKDEMIKANNPIIEFPKNDKLIVVDIQPQYAKAMPFSIEQFAKTLRVFQGEILYFFNGSAMGLDKKEDLVNWYMSSLNDYSDEFRNFLRNITWIEKGFGWLRDSMDEGFNTEDIQIIFLYLLARKYWTTMELKDEEIESLLIDEKLKEKLRNKEHVLAVPNFDINILKNFDGATICGGAKNECLKELMIIMDALDLKYIKFEPFIY